MSHIKAYVSSREKLLAMIEEFLVAHPEISARSFGWKAIEDVELVDRLRRGGDITTAKMDVILRFISTYN